MAFDLIAPNRRAYIDLCDELLFDVATLAGVRGPAMDRLWDEFYDGPRFSAEESNALAGELRAVHQSMAAHPDIIRIAWDSQTDVHRAHYPLPAPGTLEAKCLELVRVCEDGVQSGEGLSSLSD